MGICRSQLTFNIRLTWLTACNPCGHRQSVAVTCFGGLLNCKKKKKEIDFMLEVVVFWIVTPCNDVVGLQRFGGPY